MAGCKFTAKASAVATSNTPTSVLGVKAPANQAVVLRGVSVGFDGVDATKKPALIEICSATFATNSPGTNSTSITPSHDDSGRPETLQSTAAKTWTAEPTVLTVIDAFPVASNQGTIIFFYPEEEKKTARGGYGFVIRVTQGDAITPNFAGTLHLEE